MIKVIKKFKNSKIVLFMYKYFRYFLTIISPSLNTKITYRISKGKKIDLKNPVTLDEKISWLKLYIYNNDPLVKLCADKYRVREYIKDCGLSNTLSHMIGKYDDIREVNWTELPNKFALKLNVGCGGNYICQDKTNVNVSRVNRYFKKLKHKKFHLSHSELQYKNVKQVIICEEFLSSDKGSLPEDYKVYCFNGKPLFLMLCVGREMGHPKYYFFDREWTFLRINKDGRNAPQNFTIDKLDGIDEIFNYAEVLSQPFPFVRVDFYLVNNKPIFGEMTFTPSGGIDSNLPDDTDQYMGKLLDLNVYYKNKSL